MLAEQAGWLTVERRKQIILLGVLWLAFLLLTWLIYWAGIDTILADRVYAFNGGVWAWKRAFLTNTVIHRWGRWLSIGLYGVVALAFLRCVISAEHRVWVRPLGYLLVAVLVSTVLVATVKQFSGTACPWGYARYGGELEYIAKWLPVPCYDCTGKCFPAGHASAGYSWLALYFFFLALPTVDRWSGALWGLAFGLGLGMIFGISQQLRGAHFFSHDLWTLMLCWTVSALVAVLFFETPAYSFERQLSDE